MSSRALNPDLKGDPVWAISLALWSQLETNNKDAAHEKITQARRVLLLRKSERTELRINTSLPSLERNRRAARNALSRL